MELIPEMPQQWEARDEGEGLGIFTDQTMQMEPNYSDSLATAMLPMPDTSEADWWYEFYSMLSSNQGEHAEAPYTEAAQTMDNMVPQVPYAMPAHNISSVAPAFSPERSQEQCPFDQTVQMEPSPRAHKKIKLSVPEPSEAGCSIDSSSEMLQTDQYLAISDLPLGMTLRR
ncbi:uncharacterized protein LOC124892427 [Capsicum annuum]|uniref:uncharacterized protein LOC124892427 n=1 Tax=Capsicum annuum TaxID=4072 RepID=UPI001FB14B01|nr:uncharacterized protein LOC124892427 [Capsicum annuum]